MSHEIETGTIDGVETASFYSHRETPWHRLGTITEDAQDAEGALRIAHLDWTVEKYPLVASVPELTEDGVGTVQVPVPGKFATVRVNPFTGKPETLGVVGKGYTVVQNSDNADFLNAIVEESGAHFETAGSLNGGRQVFITMKAPKGLMIGGRDAVDLYLVATNSHDGTSTFKVAATPTRVVCANTLRAGLAGARATFATRHTAGAKGRIEEARRALGVMWNYWEHFEATANAMVEKKVTDQQFAKVVAGLFPAEKDETDRMKRTREQAIASITTLHREAPTQDGIRGTAWGAYNAVTEYVDWAWPVRGNENARAERIAVGGWTDTIKQAAFTALR